MINFEDHAAHCRKARETIIIIIIINNADVIFDPWLPTKQTVTGFQSQAGEARSDELLKTKVLRKITGGQAEVLRALR